MDLRGKLLRALYHATSLEDAVYVYLALYLFIFLVTYASVTCR